MAFKPENLECATLAWKSDQQRLNNYTTTDTVAVTKGANYFVTDKLRKGDLVQANCAGVAVLLKVDSVNPVAVTQATFA